METSHIELQLSLAAIDKAEKRLAHMAGQVNSLPPETANTQIRQLGRQVLTDMEQRLYKLYTYHRTLVADLTAK